MKKYEITKNGIDDYILRYKEKEIHLKPTVNVVNKMQEVNKNARINMLLDISKKGMTLKELVKEEKKDGKTYYDNSLKEELEKIYIEQETSNVFQEEIKEMTGMTLIELLQDIELNDEEEIKEFSTELGQVMIGRFPSR